tara:strand:+ start:178 stop:447 length:270 start_codon:yes stop_codon:yes gene_type:complete
MNTVTPHGIFKALRYTDSDALSTKAIAIAAHIDTTSENLREIANRLLDVHHQHLTVDGSSTRFWLRVDDTNAWPNSVGAGLWNYKTDSQ